METKDTKKTLEGSASTENGVKRLLIVGISIVLEIVLIFMLLTRLQEYAEWINVIIGILAFVLVLVLYAQDKTSSMKMPWIILILTIPIVGVVLYLIVGGNYGTKKMTKRYREIDDILLPMLPAEDQTLKDVEEQFPDVAGISKYIHARSKYPVYQNTDITYYDDASDGLKAQLEALSQAKEFIFMEYHAIEDAESWKKIEDVLVNRVKHGVEVRVFYDDLGSIGFINVSFAKKLRKLGIDCRVFNPVLPGLNLFLNNRDHRKITVVDGKVGFTGGYNLANEYFNLTHPYGLWKDTGIRLEGDAVKSLTVTFLEMWNAVRDDDKNDADYTKYLPNYDYQASEKGFIQPYADMPMDKEQVGEDVYISIANKANRYCYYITPYLILTDEMTHALTLAAKRGVDVRIITPGIPDKKLVYYVTRSYYPSLVSKGVRIFEWTPGFCHAKMCIADDLMATCGTINLDYRSLYHHFENACFMLNASVIPQIKQDFDKTIEESREVTDLYREGKKYLQIGQLFLRFFAELL